MTEAGIETTMVETQVTARMPMDTNLAVEQHREAGLNALARMSDVQFEERMRSLRVGLDRFDRMMREVLEPGVDIMTIEGIAKPILTLSGAEKTCFVARLVPTFTIECVAGLPPETPAIRYTVRCNLHLGNADGPVVAQGVGSANSHERKYRWRYAEKHCPECGVVGALVLSKFSAKPGTEFAGSKPYFCWKKKGGCGKEFSETDERITKQTLGMVENPDPYDLDNTLLKMAKKRAYVDATKTATCASGRVTVDLDEGTSGTGEAQKLRDAVFERARTLKWTTLGPIMEAVRKATGKAVRTKAELDELTANELAKTLAAMPRPVDEDDSAQGIAADEDGRMTEETHGDE